MFVASLIFFYSVAAVALLLAGVSALPSVRARVASLDGRKEALRQLKLAQESAVYEREAFLTGELLAHAEAAAQRMLETATRLARAEAELREVGERKQTLTARESEVVGLLASGLSNREIAERLVISQKTVATHIQHILEKLELKSPGEAVELTNAETLAKAFGDVQRSLEDALQQVRTTAVSPGGPTRDEPTR
jgi:ATP/maltotriose-dependent transcriptional regulator MalT